MPAGYTPDCLFDAQPSELVTLNECSADFKGCKFSFWHDSDEGIDSYTNANLQEKIRIYFQYFNKTEDFKNNGDIDLDYTITAVLCPSFIDKWKNKGLLPDDINLDKSKTLENTIKKIYSLYLHHSNVSVVTVVSLATRGRRRPESWQRR